MPTPSNTMPLRDYLSFLDSDPPETNILTASGGVLTGGATSGSPTLSTLRVGETLVVEARTRDELNQLASAPPPAVNFNLITLFSSDDSVFTVAQTETDINAGTAFATVTGVRPGVAKVLQISDQGVPPLELLTIIVLDANALVVALRYSTITSVFDDVNKTVIFRSVIADEPGFQVEAVPVDARYTIGSGVPTYGVSDVRWSSAGHTVQFGRFDGDSLSLTLNDSLVAWILVSATDIIAAGGLETVTVVATNWRGQTITGTLYLRCLFPAVVEAFLVTS